jgi:hypothetical protein
MRRKMKMRMAGNVSVPSNTLVVCSVRDDPMMAPDDLEGELPSPGAAPAN